MKPIVFVSIYHLIVNIQYDDIFVLFTLEASGSASGSCSFDTAKNAISAGVSSMLTTIKEKRIPPRYEGFYYVSY